MKSSLETKITPAPNPSKFLVVDIHNLLVLGEISKSIGWYKLVVPSIKTGILVHVDPASLDFQIPKSLGPKIWVADPSLR